MNLRIRPLTNSKTAFSYNLAKYLDSPREEKLNIVTNISIKIHLCLFKTLNVIISSPQFQSQIFIVSIFLLHDVEKV